MQMENFGDSPADILKWTKEREREKQDAMGAVEKRFGEW
eukprot:CAMPEP_0181346286 /NCGR_PEP_ID=MMETSP1101-20121128/33246_1 /TAXON_ID=46948 /ORGANISM="Rhodomonas abbreviata, Strain Caron Lab Isolate" /LENGTH=38 /DNA_ID= /DNA_START= /DNA_END= /DNA_ORIENTATION=